MRLGRQFLWQLRYRFGIGAYSKDGRHWRHVWPGWVFSGHLKHRAADAPSGQTIYIDWIHMRLQQSRYYLNTSYSSYVRFDSQPTHQMSLLVPCPVSLTTSGAIQYGVPRIDLSRRFLLSAVALVLTFRHSRLAQPKSMSLMTPLCISMMFPPLISLQCKILSQMMICDVARYKFIQWPMKVHIICACDVHDLCRYWPVYDVVGV